MNDPLTEAEIGFSHIIRRLRSSNQLLSRATIVPFAEVKFPQVATDYDALIQGWQTKGLVQGSLELFELTLTGESFVEKVCQQYSYHATFYNGFYRLASTSPAHGLFCERVYGKNLCQHGMADMEQLQILCDELQIRPGMSVLDFGCGDGRISEYISDATGAFFCGIDIAGEAIALAQSRTCNKRDRLLFTYADLELASDVLPTKTFDRLFAIDSLSFVRDQLAVVKIFLEVLRPTGKMGLFYFSRDPVEAGETVLGTILNNLHVIYTTCDFSKQNRLHWKLKKQILLELKPLFDQEGSQFLYKNRLAECDGWEHSRRYLYIINR